MQFKRFIFLVIFIIIHTAVHTQNSENYQIYGQIVGEDGRPFPGAEIQLNSTGAVVKSDNDGRFIFQNIPAGKYKLTVFMNDYRGEEINTVAKINSEEGIIVVMKSNSVALESVDLFTKTIETKVKEQPFAVSVINTKKLAERDVDLNTLLNGTSGIRVQETGGMGSEFNYSINGLSGKAVKIFIDGIPMESFGSSFSISNFAINTLDRIEIYKGVTPVSFGADALGGSINLVSRTRFKNYLDVSQTVGSFNTYRTALSGKWRGKSGFTLQTNSFFNYSENNYPVWGTGVEVAGEGGRPIEGQKFRRFNDDYRSYTMKADIGYTNVKWADVFLFGLTLSEQKRGIQTGTTMAHVYGDVRYNEKFLMPSLRYSKKDFLLQNLSVDIYASINKLRGTTVDTSSYKYDWSGKPIGTVANGEMNGHRASKSMYTFDDDTQLARANFTYQIKSNQQVNLNYVYTSTTREGNDPIATAEWTIPFRFPQDLHKHIAGLSYEAALLNNRWTNTFFAKYFAYAAAVTVYDYNGGSNKELFYQNTSDNAWAFGYASKFLFPKEYTVKFSIENAARLPEAAEVLGNGNTILNAPNLQPERSLNANLSLQKAIEGNSQHVDLGLNLFFRNTENFIWLGEGFSRGTAQYENLGKTQTLGFEFEANYARSQWLEAFFNFTYQDIRNMQRFETNGAPNHVYRDRLRNTPYLMANAEVRLFLDKMLQIKPKISFFASTNYVHQYYLGWPSLGLPSAKMYIPEQFVQDAGLGYAFGEGRYSINAACRNIFNKQVYDNFLLQKPGRFFSVKLRYFLQ